MPTTHPYCLVKNDSVQAHAKCIVKAGEIGKVKLGEKKKDLTADPKLTVKTGDDSSLHAMLDFFCFSEILWKFRLIRKTAILIHDVK